ncbi:MAG: hypothetical protein V1866_02675 [archaeon]
MVQMPAKSFRNILIAMAFLLVLSLALSADAGALLSVSYSNSSSSSSSRSSQTQATSVPSVTVNKNQVVINTTYKESVFLVYGYPKVFKGIDNQSPNLEVKPGLTTSPSSPSGFISSKGGANSFVSRGTFDSGNYTYIIMVQDFAGNQRTDSRKFSITVSLPGCGDGILNTPFNASAPVNITLNTSFREECDDGNTRSGDGCSSLCKIEICGNSRIDSGDECDGSDMNGQACTTLDSFAGGNLSCTEECFFDTSKCYHPIKKCGNGLIDPGEECDGKNWGPIKDCLFFEEFTGGRLTCNEDCLFNTSACIGTSGGYCGDGTVTVGEQCDQRVKKKCLDFDGFTAGNLTCTGACVYDTKNCSKPGPACGDAEININESCDGSSWGNITDCLSFSAFNGGTLGCKDCHFDTSSCIVASTINCAEDGKKCSGSADCCTGFCNSSMCTAPSCTDSVTNGLESDVDCGGDCPNKCLDGSRCKSNIDCSSNYCDENGLCVVPNCDDGKENGFESDVDCGGGVCLKCTIGMKCFSPNDCESAFCDIGKCACDKSVDTDVDGMDDCWEDRYGLDKNDPSDARKDADDDGYTNLDEYIGSSDPTDPDDPGRKPTNLLPIILLTLGLLTMGGSTGFLVYSRKVLLPKKRAAMAPKPAIGQGGVGAGIQTRLPTLSGLHRLQGAKPPSPGQLTGRIASGAQLPGRTPVNSAGFSRPIQRGLNQAKTAVDPNEGFIPLSELGKKPDAAGPKQGPAQASQAPAQKSTAFNRLSSLIQGKQNQTPKDLPVKQPSQPAQAVDSQKEKKSAFEALQALSAKNKDKGKIKK